MFSVQVLGSFLLGLLPIGFEVNLRVLTIACIFYGLIGRFCVVYVRDQRLRVSPHNSIQSNTEKDNKWRESFAWFTAFNLIVHVASNYLRPKQNPLFYMRRKICCQNKIQFSFKF
jgi:uncharacterized membrane protein YkvI